MDWDGERTFLLTDIAASSDHNIIKREVQKIPKYRNHQIEVFKIWDMKVKAMPIIIGVLVIIKNMNKYVEGISET